MIIALIVGILGVAFSCFMMIKNDITYVNRNIITEAIYAYALDIIANNDFSANPKPIYEVTYEDMESYDTTLWRLFDFGFTRILPKEKLKIVAPYIVDQI